MKRRILRCMGVTSCLIVFSGSGRGSLAPPMMRHVPQGFDGTVSFASDLSTEAARRATAALDAETVSRVTSASDYGGLVCLMNIIGPKLTVQMNMEAKALRQSLQPSTYWNRWQEGRGDAYRLIDKETCELMGYSALTFAVHLLAAVCQRLDELGRGGSTGVRPTSKLQLACFPAGSEGYVAHTDGSALEELEDSMPPDQRAMISSRRVTAILYLNETWHMPT
eukprot:g19304.t1